MHAAVSTEPGTAAARIRHAAERLQRAIERAIAAVRSPSRTPAALAKRLGVHRTLASRLLAAVKTDDALAAVNRMPRREGLYLFLNAARANVGETVELSEAAAAVDEFDSLVRRELGSWDALDAAIVEWLPEAREKFEIGNRQLAFRAMAGLYGAQLDVHAITAIYHPDDSGQRCDIAVITGLYGLRRLRPGVRIPVTALGPHPRDPRGGGYEVEWLSDGGERPLLSQFCSQPLPDVAEVQIGQLTQYMLVGDEIGSGSDADLVTAFVTRSLRPLTREPRDGRQKVAVSAGIELPARALLLSVLLDERVFPDQAPALAVYDTHVRGVASPNDPTRDADRLETVDQIQFLGRGAQRFRSADVGRHVEQVEEVCGRLGWDADRLRGWRCTAHYPLIHAQYVMMFDPPPAGATGGA